MRCKVLPPFSDHLTLRQSRCDGWYQNGTMAKVKTIMKEKVNGLRSGRQTSTVDLAKLLALPDIITDTNRTHAQVPRGATSREVELASEIRMKAGRGHSGRLPLGKGESRTSHGESRPESEDGPATRGSTLERQDERVAEVMLELRSTRRDLDEAPPEAEGEDTQCLRDGSKTG